MLRQLRQKNTCGAPIKIIKSKRYLIKNIAHTKAINKPAIRTTERSSTVRQCLSFKKKYTTCKVNQRPSTIRTNNPFRKKHAPSKGAVRAQVSCIINARKISNNHFLPFSKKKSMRFVGLSCHEVKPLNERYSFYKRFSVNPNTNQRSVRDVLRKKSKKLKTSIDNIEFLFGNNERPYKRYYPVQVNSFLKKIRKKKREREENYDKPPQDTMRFSDISSKIKDFFLQYIDPPGKTEKVKGEIGLLDQVSTMIDDCTSQIKEFFGFATKPVKITKESGDAIATTIKPVPETESNSEQKITASSKPNYVSKKKMPEGKEYSTYWTKYRLESENDVEKIIKQETWEKKKDQALIIGMSKLRLYNKKRRPRLTHKRIEPELLIEKQIKLKEKPLKKVVVPTLQEGDYYSKRLMDKKLNRLESPVGNVESVYASAERSLHKMKKKKRVKNTTGNEKQVYQPLGRYSLKYSLADEDATQWKRRTVKGSRKNSRPSREDFRNWK